MSVWKYNVDKKYEWKYLQHQDLKTFSLNLPHRMIWHLAFEAKIHPTLEITCIILVLMHKI